MSEDSLRLLLHRKKFALEFAKLYFASEFQNFNQMVTVYYLLDKRAAYKASKSIPVLADIKYDHNGMREHFRFAVGISGNPKNFIRQEFHGREPNADPKNALLRRIKETAEGIYFDGIKRGTLPDKSEFKARIINSLSYAEKEKTTMDHFADYMAGLAAKKKSKSFKLAMGKLGDVLIELRDKGHSIRFQDIDLTFETKMRQVLNDRGYRINTVSAYIKRMKMFMNWASKNNLHQNQIYKLFEMEEESREIIALSETEVENIASLNIPIHKHVESGGTKICRDWFIISTQTALRYSDFPKMAQAKIIQVPGGFDIAIKTTKTKTDVVIPVSRLLYKVLSEYEFNVPPPPSNQKYNAGLKRIANLAKLNKEISSHTGRKTFCTTMYRRGVPVPQIMKISGHKTEKEFYKYIGVSLTENAALVRESNADFKFESTQLKIA
jgi:integrase